MTTLSGYWLVCTIYHVAGTNSGALALYRVAATAL